MWLELAIGVFPRKVCSFETARKTKTEQNQKEEKEGEEGEVF